MSSVFNLGGVLNAIFPPKILQRYYDTIAKEQGDLLTKKIGTISGLNDADLAKFSADATRASETVRGLEPADMALYGNIIKTLGSSDPLATRAAVGKQNIDLFDAYAKRVGDATNLSDNIRSARLGYGERGPSSYTTTLIADRTAKNLSPALAAMMGSLGLDTSRVLSDRRSDFGAAAAASDARASIPYRVLDLDLAPITARLNTLGSEQALVGNAIDNSRRNTAGFEEKKNKWAAATQEIDKSLNSALDTYLSLYGGGMIGGGQGAFGGAFGGERPAAGGMKQMGGAPGGGGGAGGGFRVGGMDLSSIIALLNQYQGSRNTPQRNTPYMSGMTDFDFSNLNLRGY